MVLDSRSKVRSCLLYGSRHVTLSSYVGEELNYITTSICADIYNIIRQCTIRYSFALLEDDKFIMYLACVEPSFHEAFMRSCRNIIMLIRKQMQPSSSPCHCRTPCVFSSGPFDIQSSSNLPHHIWSSRTSCCVPPSDSAYCS